MEALANPSDLVTACRPMMHLSTVFGLCPAPDPPSRPSWWLKLAHTLLVAVLVLSGLGALLTARSLTAYRYAIPTMSVTDAAMLCLATTTCLVNLGVFAAYGRERAARALRLLQEVDRQLLAGDAPRVYRKTVAIQVVELGVVLFLVVLVFCYDNIVWYEGIVDRLVGLFAVYFTQLVNLVSMLQLVNLVLAIGHRQGRINDKLSSGELFADPASEKQDNGTSVDGGGVVLGVDELTQAARVRDLTRQLDALCDAARCANVAFGVQALLDASTVLVTVTSDVYFAVTFAQVELSGQPAPRRAWDGLLVSLLWTAVNLGKSLGVVSACSWARARSRRGAVLAQKALLREDVRSDAVTELQLLVQQTALGRVRFTAWGFFPLSHSTFCGMIGAITMYLVILLQFQQITK
ncbi:gustatory receptor 68a-like [Bacillus rossius redtenbacheri]|uniref:gustatory receptor 68a-like n=1 Tax=Bacillus rossius redtenbacheri TaxID=93214 RepID=UPI002FDE6BA5